MELYSHQQSSYNDIYSEWLRGIMHVLLVMPTGSGKTALFTKIMADTAGYAVATAHRRELVCQISTALARWRVPHRIIAPNPIIRLCVSQHMKELGRSYHNPRADKAVAAVDTLLQPKRFNRLRDFLARVVLHVADEAHHVLWNPMNKWGRGFELTPEARYLGVTATAIRADGKGLGHRSNGVFQSLVHGVRMRWLIENGYLKKYRIFNAQRRGLNLRQDDINKSGGEYKAKSVDRAVRENHIIGDIVATYIQHAMGKRGITFMPNVELAKEVANDFNAAGVPAMAVWDKTSDEARESAVRRLASGELLQLVNVDLFGEGFDLPSIECASFGRPTLSYGLYVQQFGRPLRPTPGVDTALIFDHVGNVIEHGLPDGNVRYTLDAPERHRKLNGTVKATTCDNCSNMYERALKECPYCGWVPEITQRSAPEFVDGDLVELDEETLARMRGEADKAVQPVEDYAAWLRNNCPQAGIRRNLRLHEDRIMAQGRLRDAIAVWGGYQRDDGLNDSQIYRRFFNNFGMDVLTAQALNAAGALELEGKILRCV